MPVRKISTPEQEDYPDLVRELVAELRVNRAQGPAEAPEIIEETYRFGNLRHVTVIWDKWRDIDPEIRGRVIMEAYQQYEEAPPLNITQALGLTREEAAKFHQAPVQPAH